MALAKSSRILVTGANRGLGLEFVRQWLGEGHQLLALARNPGSSPELQALKKKHGASLQMFEVDVANSEMVDRTAAAVRSTCAAIDVLVNNAGRFKERRGSVENMDLENAMRTFDVNTLGALRIARSFLPLLRRGQDPRLVHISSLMGSIGDNGSGGAYAYRMSKAALNMASRNLAHDLAEWKIPSVVLHPGWVQTDMGGESAPTTIEESVTGMRAVIEGLGPEDSGSFYDYRGESLPW